MGCSSDKQIKLYDNHTKFHKQNNEKINSKNNTDLLDKFLYKPKVKKYFQNIFESFELKDSNNGLLLSGLFETIQEDLTNLFKRFEIDLIIPTESGIVKCDSFRLDYLPSTQFDLDFFIPLFLFEFFLYSKSLINRIKLKSITFVHSLSYSSKHIINQYRAAVPDFLHTKSIYISTKETNPNYIRNIIHHEIFHFVDWAHDNSFDDEDWKKLNVPGFEYGKVNFLEEDWNRYKGFVSFCSVYGLEEDKAEIFYYLMSNPKNALGNTDEIVKLKVQRMVCFMKEIDPNGIGRSSEDYFEYIESVRVKIFLIED